MVIKNKSSALVACRMPLPDYYRLCEIGGDSLSPGQLSKIAIRHLLDSGELARLLSESVDKQAQVA